MTFRAWLKQQATREGPVGDLARDCETDPGLPKRLTPGTLRAYLRWIDACDGAVDAAWAACEEWEKATKLRAAGTGVALIRV